MRREDGERFYTGVMFIVAANSVKYGLHTNIIPQEGYKAGYKKMMPVDRPLRV